MGAANVYTTFGGVLENHEITGGPYNNIAGPVLSAPSAVGQMQALPAPAPFKPQVGVYIELHVHFACVPTGVWTIVQW